MDFSVVKNFAMLLSRKSHCYIIIALLPFHAQDDWYIASNTMIDVDGFYFASHGLL